MSKIIIPEHLKGKELYNFLIANKSSIIAQKRRFIKQSEPMSASLSLYHYKDNGVVKADNGTDIPADATSVRVKVVANAANWCDTAYDVLLADCWAKSIKERQGKVPFLNQHIWKLDAQVGDVIKFYSQDVSLVDLGWDQAGSTQALIFEADIKKDYNPVVFNLYKAKKVNQHSIGMYYVKLELCINDADYKEEFAAWNKYAGLVINQDVIDLSGYFWAVQEIQLLENSGVLFGANELTPTLDVSKESTQEEPPTGTQEEPPAKKTSIDFLSLIN